MFIKKSKEFDSLVLRDHNKQDKSFDDEVDSILEKSLKGGEVTEKEGVVLFNLDNNLIHKVFNAADKLRARSNGDRVTFVVNRNINFTNVCYMGCKFCGLSLIHI